MITQLHDKVKFDVEAEWDRNNDHQTVNLSIRLDPVTELPHKCPCTQGYICYKNVIESLNAFEKFYVFIKLTLEALQPRHR
jgi:hypothetical protein